jgi:hypothetical protein
MEKNQRNVTITLKPSQFEALSELAEKDQCDIEQLVSRSVDTFIATYRLTETRASLPERLEKMHQQTVRLLVSLMKLVAQTLYFSSLPVTTGPVKARLNDEGVAIQWRKSEKFALDLLAPKEVHSQSVTDVKAPDLHA